MTTTTTTNDINMEDFPLLERVWIELSSNVPADFEQTLQFESLRPQDVDGLARECGDFFETVSKSLLNQSFLPQIQKEKAFHLISMVYLIVDRFPDQRQWDDNFEALITLLLKSTSSSKSMKQRPDSIASIRIPHVPTLSVALNSNNDDDENNNNADNITDDNDLDNTICSYEDDDDESDSDCDDSCIFALPPVQFVCVPINCSHADALLSQTTQDNIKERTLLLNQPPTRIGDWDTHTIESNPDDVELSDNGNK